MAHSKGPTKGKKIIPTDSDELRKPTKLKPVNKGKLPKRAKDVSAFEEEEGEDTSMDLLAEDDILFNELGEDGFEDDDDF